MLPLHVRIGLEGRPRATAWLADLPATVDRVCATWALTPGPVLEGGKGALVMRVRRAGEDAVLKITPPDVPITAQVATIAAAGGHGYVRLLAHDPAENAVLLEPLGEMLLTSGRPITAQLDILAATLIEAWRTPKPPATGWHKAAELRAAIEDDWRRLDGPCPIEIKTMAIGYAGSRLASTAPTVRCHGDPHPANALAVPVPRPGAPAGYVFVDPDGFECEPAYDLGVTVRSFTAEVTAAPDPVGLVRGWCDRLAAATGVDAQAIWEWAFTERVSSGLYLMASGHTAEGRAHLDSAGRLVGT